MAPLPDPKLTQAKALANNGDWYGCLRIIARFPVLGVQKAAITRAWSALQRPEFYEELGINVPDAWAAAITAICERYDWPLPYPMPACPIT